MQEHEAQRARVDFHRLHDAGSLDRTIDRSIDRTIEREIIPRLLMSHRTGSIPYGGSHGRDSGEIDRRTFREFMDGIRSRHDDVAVEILRTLLQGGTTPEVIMMDLLAPAANTMGEMWYRDDCGFVDVTVATGRLQRMLRELGQQQAHVSSKYSSPGRIIVSSLPGEQHTLGLYIVAEFFYSDGWGVVIGPPVAESSTAELVKSEWFDVVALSVARDDALLPLRREIAAVRRNSMNTDIRILVGGHAVNEHRDAVKLLGADARAADPQDGVRIAHQLLAEASLCK